MSETEHAAALADAIEGTDDACLGPTDIVLVVKALRALVETIFSVTASADLEPA